jgi:hypothetical protein
MLITKCFKLPLRPDVVLLRLELLRSKEVVQRVFARITTLVPSVEIAHPLLGSSVGEAVWDNVALALLLDGIIANGGGCPDGFFEVAFTQ